MARRIEVDTNYVGEMVGSGRVGTLPEGTKYEDIVKVFGEPYYKDSEDERTKAEWAGNINNCRGFTIYDYKSGVSLEENTDWYIGGFSEGTANLINEYFENFSEVLV